MVSKQPKYHYSTFASDGSQNVAARHPVTSSSWFSLATFGWVTPLVALGNEKQLDASNVWPLQHHHQVAVICTRFAAD